MLGRAWRELLQAHHVNFAAPGLDQVDFTRIETIERALSTGGARLVINCAAWTVVDGAETDEAAATQINGAAVGALAQTCRRTGATLVHYSTDYVFDGAAQTPYATGHPRAPLGAYGRSKAAGEEAVEASGADALIVRTSWLYAPWGKNFVRTIRSLVLSKPEIRVVADQRGRPTSAEGLALTTARLLGAGARGIRHATDAGECSWFEFACEIARLTPGAGKVLPCTTAEFPRPAARPAYSVLDLSETERDVGPMIHWTQNLADVLRRVET